MLGIGIVAAGSIRSNAALLHLRAARRHSRACDHLEREHEWPATDGILGEHFARATGAVLSATCALEAFINEFYQDAVDGSDSELGVASAARKEIVDLWDTVDRAPTLRKYQWVLSLARVDSMPEGEDPYQSAADLVALRNALAHYRPEWYHERRVSDKLEKRLLGRFPTNRLAPSSMAFIPHRAIGAGCGHWSVATVVSLVQRFYAGLQVVPKKVARIAAFVDEAAE